MATSAQNVYDSDFLEHPDHISLGFVVGMFITCLIGWIFLAIGLALTSLLQRVNAKKKAFANR